MIKMEDLNYTVRLMEKADVPEALEVYRQTGMQEGTHSLYTWLEVDKEAFKIAVKNSGEIIAVCGAVVHPPGFAFIGIYCCLEKYRGRGVGKKVWEACMKHVAERNVGLYSLPGTFKMYRDKGIFSTIENRWTCIVNRTENRINYEALSDKIPEDITIEPYQDTLLEPITEFDFSIVGYDRKVALGLSCNETDSKTLVALRDGKCVGFGTIRITCQNFSLVGPLYADNVVVAEVILRRLIVSFHKARGFAMMTISTINSANELVKKIGCPPIRECFGFFRTKAIEADVNKIFALWSLNMSPY